MHQVRIVTPISSLGGRRFEPRAELMLHALAETAAATLPGLDDEVMLIPEMPSPLGVPDFVALVGGLGWLHARRESGVAPQLAGADCQVLASLHASRALSIGSLMARLDWTLSELSPVLARLVRAGAAEMTARGSYRINPSLVPSGSILALEAKVKDWQKAVHQGRAYRTWANNYVVLMGSLGPIAAQRARETVLADGAGLFIESGWLARPRVRKPSASRRLRGFEHVFAAIAQSNPAL